MTAFVREIDKLGRITLPMEIRKAYGINVGSQIEFCITNGGELILRKFDQGCTFCMGTEELQNIKGYWVCKACVEYSDLYRGKPDKKEGS